MQSYYLDIKKITYYLNIMESKVNDKHSFFTLVEE